MKSEVHGIDDALVRLRRLWSTSARGSAVEMSGVLVVEACARAGDEGATVGEVARFVDVEHSTASRLIERAVRGGLVERTASARDARRAALRLTPAGRRLRERSVTFRTAWLTSTLDGWSATDVAAFGRLLGRFAQAVNERGGPGALLDQAE